MADASANREPAAEATADALGADASGPAGSGAAGGADLATAAAIDFLAELLADRAAGTEHPLAHYLQRHPRHEAVLAAEWVRMHDADARAGATAGPGDGFAAAAAAAAAADAGVRFRGLTLVRELGRGGQGVVYLARDERLGRDVALKVLRGGIGALQGVAALRFAREAEALARVDHPSVCTVYGVGGDDQESWIAMKLVDGPSLERELERRRAAGRPPAAADVAQAAWWIEQVANGLASAHAAGLVHRDLKPGNVLLGRDGVPVLVDFGIARVDDASVTLPGLVPGTAAYLAPELLREQPADERSDVWSLGACLYELITGRRPYGAATVAGELQARATRQVPDARRHNRAVPRDLALVAATALASFPDQRYASARAFAEDLRRVRCREPIAARSPSPALVLRRWAQRNPALATSLGVLLVVLLAALAVTASLLRDTRRALADVTRLSDLKACTALAERAAAPHPLREQRLAGADGLDAWLADADAVLARRPLHEAALQRLLGEPGDAAGWQREQLGALLAALDALAALRVRVAADRAFAATVRQRTLVDHADAWRMAIDAIARSPRYGGLRIAPQLGLVPLGADPHSGLHEFAHLQTGEVPRRDAATGALGLGEASGVVLVLVPGGDARLGCEAAPRAGADTNVDRDALAGEGPTYTVTLAPFLLGKHELTQAQWSRAIGANPSNYTSASEVGSERLDARNPVEQMRWDDAERAVRRLDLCLPTEAQWEHAYRAGSVHVYPFGDERRELQGRENLADADARAATSSAQWQFEPDLHDGRCVHAPVGSYAPNAFGLFDLGGNVREWCADSWEELAEIPPRAGDGLRFGRYPRYRVVRGGAFDSGANQARCGYRNGLPLTVAAPDVGVRPARAIEP